MIIIPKNKVAVIPVFDSDETKKGIVKPSSFNYLREQVIFEIFTAGRKLDEAEDIERARYLVDKYEHKGYPIVYHRKKKVKVEDQPLDSGERCDQGVVKYIGEDVKSVQIGDYVFFSGYTGTLMRIDGEGQLIVLPEKFIECIFDIEKFHEVPGLYFKSRDGSFFPATYEESMNIIAQTFTDLKLTVEVVPSEPKVEDYNER